VVVVVVGQAMFVETMELVAETTVVVVLEEEQALVVECRVLWF
jgi:hypothetical protein